jgi:cytidylate kinase
MKDQTREEPSILAAAERQMQAWVLSAEMEGRVRGLKGRQRLAAQINPYLTISREAGAGGGLIAEQVGQRLGWKVLDKNLADRVAERFRLPRVMLELVDETQSNWVYDVLGAWLDRKIIPHDKYVAHMGRVVLAAARRESVVLVGRGAQFLLPREKGLAVRIIAPKRFRVEQIMQLGQLSRVNAGRFVDDVDRGRRDFVRRFFHHDIDEPHLYDLVINVEQIGHNGAIEQILAAVNRSDS